MSRIHDALKKAAAEKTTQERDADLAAVAAGENGHRIATSLSTVVEETPRIVPGRDPRTILRFEDLTKKCADGKWKPGLSLELSRCGEVGKVAAEGFKTLRSRLYQTGRMKPLRRILVTSSVPGEGKTFVATNLAQAMAAQSERRVLLIDADLRARDTEQVVGTQTPRGLSDYLRSESDECGIIQNNLERNLWFISSGTSVPNPSELLLSGRMKILLDRLTPLFDWVIVDSPPTLAVHDASTLADLCDGVLFVVRAGTTSCESAQKACLEFRSSKNLLGLVLNQVEKAEIQETYYGYSPNKTK
jgi:protein-tyrosine kinase